MKTAWAFAALAVFATSALAGEACGPLKIVGQADMISTEGVLLVPVKVDGHDARMIVDTGGWYRELSPELANKLKLPITRRPYGAFDVTGRPMNESVTVDNFEIGSAKASNIVFFVPPNGFGDSQIDGLIGPQLLTSFDIDLDFPAKRISFILQDHCDGKVVYWKTPSYAAVPFLLTDEGHIRLPVELDGQKFTALLDTGAERSSISLRAAESAFGITENSPGVTKGDFVNGDKRAQEYRRTFKTLTIAGITFNNPTLSMFPDLLRNHLINAHRPKINSHIDTNNEAEGLDDITVGLEELRRLHVYIAYKEQKLYISPAAPTAAAQPSTP
jgi:predicted aspartyl protease